jgi:hypothetical protein
MSAVAFDTLKFAQNLRDKANFSPTQAEGISEAFSEAIAGQLATRADLVALATKDDLAALGKATKDDLAAQGKATKDDLAALGKATKDELTALSKELAEFKLETRNDFARLENKIEGLKTETLRWIVGAIGLQTIAVIGTFIGLVRFLVH